MDDVAPIVKKEEDSDDDEDKLKRFGYINPFWSDEEPDETKTEVESGAKSTKKLIKVDDVATPWEPIYKPVRQLLYELRNEYLLYNQLPVFQLLVEALPNYVVRRYRVLVDPGPWKRSTDCIVDRAAFEKISRDQQRNEDVSLLKSQSGVPRVLMRIDRGPKYLKELMDELFYKSNSYHDDVAWPLQVKLQGNPICCKGPSFYASSVYDLKLIGRLDWVKAIMYPVDTEVPYYEGILCGVKNYSFCNEDVPPEALIQTKKRKRFPQYDMGIMDKLVLDPPLMAPDEWTLDCLFKWPLRSNNPEKVLLAPGADAPGAYIMWQGNTIGAEVPLEEGSAPPMIEVNSLRGGRKRFYPARNANTFFSPATAIDKEGKKWKRNFNVLLHDWHRLTVVGSRRDSKPIISFYLNGGFIGDCLSPPLSPFCYFGNRAGGGSPLGGVFARMRIFYRKMAGEEIASIVNLESAPSEILDWGVYRKEDWIPG